MMAWDQFAPCEQVLLVIMLIVVVALALVGCYFLISRLAGYTHLPRVTRACGGSELHHLAYITEEEAKMLMDEPNNGAGKSRPGTQGVKCYPKEEISKKKRGSMPYSRENSPELHPGNTSAPDKVKKKDQNFHGEGGREIAMRRALLATRVEANTPSAYTIPAGISQERFGEDASARYYFAYDIATEMDDTLRAAGRAPVHVDNLKRLGVTLRGHPNVPNSGEVSSSDDS